MNLDLVATFKGVAVDLLATFGRPVTHTNSDGDEATVQAVIETRLEPVGDWGERMETRTTIQVLKTSGVAVNDTFSEAGTVTADDPYPDDVVWQAVQALADDGYVLTFAARPVE
jgi:hypothetical protein